MRIDESISESDREKLKIVRADNLTDIPIPTGGKILLADEVSGEVRIKVGDNIKKDSFGPNGIKVIPKR